MNVLAFIVADLRRDPGDALARAALGDFLIDYPPGDSGPSALPPWLTRLVTLRTPPRHDRCEVGVLLELESAAGGPGVFQGLRVSSVPAGDIDLFLWSVRSDPPRRRPAPDAGAVERLLLAPCIWIPLPEGGGLFLVVPPLTMPARRRWFYDRAGDELVALDSESPRRFAAYHERPVEASRPWRGRRLQVSRYARSVPIPFTPEYVR